MQILFQDLESRGGQDLADLVWTQTWYFLDWVQSSLHKD